MKTYLLLSIIYLSSKIGKNIKYRLVKENIITDFKLIKEPEIFATTRKIMNYPDFSDNMQNIINRFYVELKSEVSKESMEVIKKNLKSVRSSSNYLQSLILCIRFAGGQYNPLFHTISENYLLTKINIDNKIEGNKLFQKVIAHELMHAASSHIVDNKVFSGFHQQCNGVGINEGYTDLLSNRYIVDKNLNISGIDCGYGYETAVAELIELVVGKDKMINLFFQGNLGGLIGELSKYQEEKKVKQFIVDLDTFLHTRRDHFIVEKNEILGTLYNRISLFIYNAFSNKYSDNVNINNISNYLEDSKKYIEVFSRIEKNNPLYSNKSKRR